MRCRTSSGGGAEGGILYEILDGDLKPVANVTLETLVADWKANR